MRLVSGVRITEFICSGTGKGSEWEREKVRRDFGCFEENSFLRAYLTRRWESCILILSSFARSILFFLFWLISPHFSPHSHRIACSTITTTRGQSKQRRFRRRRLGLVFIGSVSEHICKQTLVQVKWILHRACKADSALFVVWLWSHLSIDWRAYNEQAEQNDRPETPFSIIFCHCHCARSRCLACFVARSAGKLWYFSPSLSLSRTNSSHPSILTTSSSSRGDNISSTDDDDHSGNNKRRSQTLNKKS